MLKKYSHHALHTTPGVVCVCIMFVIVGAAAVRAANMSSSNYKIIFGTVNSGGNNTGSNNYKLAISLGQVAAERFTSAGFIVKAGFQYVRTLYPFYFSISDTTIDFGTLLPGDPVTRPFTLTVRSRSQGYDVLGIEQTKFMRLFSSDIIADTSCNGGGETCSETLAKLWDSPSAYGFGFNVQGEDAAPDFTSTDHYRPFPATTDGEDPYYVMTSEIVGTDPERQATVTLKAHINATQAAGSYQTVLVFIAYPKY